MTTAAGIISIAIGFIFFGTCFYLVATKFTRDGKVGSETSKKAWIFGILGFIFLTVIPVSLAVFRATTSGA